MPKVIVIGFDGATWDIIKPMTDKGELPTFKKLLDNGVWGKLESTIPPWTIPAWESMATGKNPKKLGFATFMVRDGYEFFPHMFKQKRQKMIWEYISDYGYKNIVANLPNIYLAQKINGVMISGFLYLDEKRLTYPPELKKELDKICNDYEVDIVIPHIKPGRVKQKFPESDKEYQLRSYNILEKHSKAFNYLLKNKEWQFAFIVFAEPDRIQHRFWTDFKIIKNVYQKLDQKLEKILEENVNNETILFLVSDHGFGQNKRIININEFMVYEQYLKLKNKPNMNSFGLNYHQIIYKLKLQKFVRFIYKNIPENLLFRSQLLQNIKSKNIPDLEIDWKNTKAYGYSVQGDIYLNVKGRDPYGSVDQKDYEKVRNEIIEKLQNIIDPNTKRNLKIKVLKREEIYSTDLRNATLPDLVVLVDNEINGISTSIGKGEIINYNNGKVGNHRLNGIFLAYGSEIKKGHEIKKIKIYDITPTILHMFNLPIPIDMDGSVITEIFEKNSKIAKRKPQYISQNNYERT